MKKQMIIIGVIGLLFLLAGFFLSGFSTNTISNTTTQTSPGATQPNYRVFQELPTIQGVDYVTTKTTLSLPLSIPKQLPIYTYTPDVSDASSLLKIHKLATSLMVEATPSSAIKNKALLSSFNSDNSTLFVGVSDGLMTFSYTAPSSPQIKASQPLDTWLSSWFINMNSDSSYVYTTKPQTNTGEGASIADRESLPLSFYTYTVVTPGGPLSISNQSSDGGVVGIDKNGYIRFFSGLIPPQITNVQEETTIDPKDLPTIITSGGAQVSLLGTGKPSEIGAPIKETSITGGQIIYMQKTGSNLLAPALSLKGVTTVSPIRPIQYLLWATVSK